MAKTTVNNVLLSGYKGYPSGRVTRKLTWYGAEAKAAISRGVTKQLKELGKFLVQDIRNNFDRAADRYDVSEPGEIPLYHSGTLSKSISWESAKHSLTLSVGVDESICSYGAALEFGAPRNNLEPRPFLLPAFDRNEQQIKRILGRAKIIY